MDWDDEGDGGRIPDTSRVSVSSVKKKPFRNKTLSVGFDEKSLQDFVTGFHKRKKKRRKEAQHQLEEKARLWRIEQRKKRKLEIELAYGKPVQNGENPDTVSDGISDGLGEDGEDVQTPAVSGKTVYDTGDTTITVTTSELCAEEDIDVHVWNHEAEKQAINVKRRLVNRMKSAKDSGKQSLTKQVAATLHDNSNVTTNNGELQPTAQGAGLWNADPRKHVISNKKNPLNALNKLKEKRRNRLGKHSGIKKGNSKGSSKHKGKSNMRGVDSRKSRGKKKFREHS